VYVVHVVFPLQPWLLTLQIYTKNWVSVTQQIKNSLAVKNNLVAQKVWASFDQALQEADYCLKYLAVMASSLCHEQLLLAVHLCRFETTSAPS